MPPQKPEEQEDEVEVRPHIEVEVIKVCELVLLSCLLIKCKQLHASVLTELQSRVLSNMPRSLCHPVLPRKKHTGRKCQDADGRGLPDSGGQCVDESKLKSYWWKAECVSLSTAFRCAKGIPVVLYSTHLFNA